MHQHNVHADSQPDSPNSFGSAATRRWSFNDRGIGSVTQMLFSRIRISSFTLCTEAAANPATDDAAATAVCIAQRCRNFVFSLLTVLQW